jgi:hypothetical protein
LPGDPAAVVAVLTDIRNLLRKDAGIAPVILTAGAFR